MPAAGRIARMADFREALAAVAAGGGGGQVGNAVTILTPTEGVDFNSYIARLVARVKQNWYAVMPESAYMGDKGIVADHVSHQSRRQLPGRESQSGENLRQGSSRYGGDVGDSHDEPVRSAASAVQGALHRTSIHLLL